MIMTDSEIVAKYQRAEDKGEYIKILAQLNGCDSGNIRRILTENGLEVPEKKKRGRKAKNADDGAEISPDVILKADRSPEESISGAGNVATIPVVDAGSAESNAVAEGAKAEHKKSCIVPDSVRLAVSMRVNELTAKVVELERERDELCDFLREAF